MALRINRSSSATHIVAKIDENGDVKKGIVYTGNLPDCNKYFGESKNHIILDKKSYGKGFSIYCDCPDVGRYVSSGIALESFPSKYPHKCEVCSKEVTLFHKVPNFRSNNGL